MSASNTSEYKRPLILVTNSEMPDAGLDILKEK